jgi:F0F1-type ATP synthase assembly protein I
VQTFTYSRNVSVHYRRETYQGFGETLARSFELVGAPLIFGFGGHFLDRWLGTSPWFLIVLSLLALAGTAVRMYYGYEHDMREEEARVLRKEAPPR